MINVVAGLIEKDGKYLIAKRGYGDLKDKTFRISHMGDYTLDDVYEVLKNIDEVLGLEVI